MLEQTTKMNGDLIQLIGDLAVENGNFVNVCNTLEKELAAKLQISFG